MGMTNKASPWSIVSWLMPEDIYCGGRGFWWEGVQDGLGMHCGCQSEWSQLGCWREKRREGYSWTDIHHCGLVVGAQERWWSLRAFHLSKEDAVNQCAVRNPLNKESKPRTKVPTIQHLAVLCILQHDCRRDMLYQRDNAASPWGGCRLC